MSDGSFRRNAWLLWIGQFISATGDALFLPCVAWLALATTGRELGAGLVAFVNAIPFLLFGAFAGAWVDRGDRRRIMVLSDGLRALLLLSMPLWALLFGGVSLPLLMVMAFLLGTFSTPFVPARDALLPQIIGNRSLTRWNAAFQTSGYMAMLVGFGLGGLLLHAMSDQGLTTTERLVRVLAIDGGTFLLSAAALLLIVLPRPAKRKPATTSITQDARAGLAYARSDPTVFGLLILTALNNLFLMGPALVGPILLLHNDFNLEPQHLAWFEGCMAIGMMVGALVLARLGRRVHPAKLLVIGLILDGITYLPFVWIESYPAALAWIGFHGFFIPWIVVSRTTIWQHRVPDEHRGKVFALSHMTVTGVTALSCLGAGALAELTGARGLFGVAGVFATATGIGAWIALYRRLRAVECDA